MKKAHLRFSPEILKRLGEELNPFLDKGILELAKNAYDADAIHCKITLEDVDRPGGRITIDDDGDGMGVEDILSGWLVLGKSGKSTKSRTRLGRVPAGSKGLGRLAALRLGQRAELVTRPRNEADTQHKLAIHWPDFEGAQTVDEVPLTVVSRQRPAAGHGTSIQLAELTSHMTRGEVLRLARELILLADPFGDDPKGFKPELIAQEFDDLAALVKKRYFKDADYQVHARLDKDGHTSAKVTDYRGQKLFSAEHAVIAGENAEVYECPEAKFDFWVFVLDSAEFSSRSVSLGEVKNWLGAFGGVHLYQNGIRVSPYGDPDDDWLNLNLRRSKHQEDNPSTNTVIGRMMVADREEVLQQKTDRSGFIETNAFRELRRFGADVTKWLHRCRADVSEIRRAKEREAALAAEKPATKALRAAIEQAPPKARKRIKSAFVANERSHQAALEKLKAEIQLYRTLSTVGITAATFAHESVGAPIKMISFAASLIESRGRRHLGEDYARLLEGQVGKIRESVQKLNILGQATFSLLDRDKRRARGIKLHEAIKQAVETLKPFTDGRDIQVVVELDAGQPYLRASEAAIESVVTNFINNSSTAFESSKATERRVCLRTEVHGRTFTLRVLDNGPGIVDISKQDIWLPGETTRPNGTGLGLTIVRDTVLDLGGNVDVVERGELGGAEFIVQLPVLRS